MTPSHCANVNTAVCWTLCRMREFRGHYMVI